MTTYFNKKFLQKKFHIVFLSTNQVFDGEEQGGSMTDLSARIFQHESEHMDGDLFIDNVSKLKLKLAMRKRNMNLRKLKRKNK